jgi:adenylate cyclase class IV
MEKIEVEFRSRFDEKKYRELLDFLSKNARDLGANDKRVWFFVMPEKLLKVTHNISKKSGEITLKLTKIGYGSSFEELEIPIDENEVEKAVRLFTELGHKYLVEPIILRHDFEYKGVEVAVKYSETWGYHAELEILVSSKDNEAEATAKIQQVANELGISIMTEVELQKFTQNIEATYVSPTKLPPVR